MLLDALYCKNKKRPPIWLMRQAGRFLPEYQKIRAHYSLLEMFATPEIIHEVTKLPVNILGVDAAILFSDILTVLNGLGVPYDFDPGPKIDFQGQFHKTEDAYPHIQQAIISLKKELTVPLIGFAGGPFTVLSYIIEGKTSRDFKKIKKLMIQNPTLFESLLEEVITETISYLKLQEKAGVDLIQIFDSWGSALPPTFFEKYVQAPLARIVKALAIPTILFCKGKAIELLPCHPTCISIDWTQKLSDQRQQIPKTIALQGNLDPTILYGSKKTIKQHAHALLEEMQGEPGFIFNLGHGMLPDIPVENVHTLIEVVQTRSPLHELSYSS